VAILSQGRLGYVHVARGKISVNGQPLQGRAMPSSSVRWIASRSAAAKAEVLLFDLPRMELFCAGVQECSSSLQ
jgi:redox-sensitive bicupin YhaK (pirin superfamily)